MGHHMFFSKSLVIIQAVEIHYARTPLGCWVEKESPSNL